MLTLLFRSELQFRFRPRALIVFLLLPCRPSAISRFVIAVIVGIAIDRQICWALSHVSEEILEMTPAFTYRNSSAAVVPELRRLWIEAPESAAAANRARLTTHGKPHYAKGPPNRAVALVTD